MEDPDCLVMSAMGPLVGSGSIVSKVPFGSTGLLFGRRSRYIRFLRAEPNWGLDVTEKVSALEPYLRGRDLRKVCAWGLSITRGV